MQWAGRIVSSLFMNDNSPRCAAQSELLFVNKTFAMRSEPHTQLKRADTSSKLHRLPHAFIHAYGSVHERLNAAQHNGADKQGVSVGAGPHSCRIAVTPRTYTYFTFFLHFFFRAGMQACVNRYSYTSSRCVGISRLFGSSDVIHLYKEIDCVWSIRSWACAYAPTRTMHSAAYDAHAHPKLTNSAKSTNSQ